MKHTGKLTALATLTLASVLVLGACGTGNAQSQPSSTKIATSSPSRTSSSSSQTLSSSSSLAQSTSTESTAERASQPAASQSSEQKTSLVELSESAVASQATPATSEVSKQIATQSSPSDFAYLAGTWANDEGKVLTVNADGTISDGAKIESDKSGALAVRFKEGFGAALFYAPAGQEFPESIAPKEYTAGTDITKERLVIAQSVGEMAHPFYRIVQ